jgi:hypothetical protein
MGTKYWLVAVRRGEAESREVLSLCSKWGEGEESKKETISAEWSEWAYGMREVEVARVR